MGELVDLDERRPARRRGGNNKGTKRSFGNVRRLPSKRFQASYTGPDGERVKAPTTFQTKGDAEAWLSREQAAIVEHRWKPAPPPEKAQAPKFREYAAEWLAGRELKPRTRDEYRKLIGLPKPETTAKRKDNRKPSPTLFDRWGGVKLDAITPAAVREWYGKLDPAKPTQRAHLFALLRTVMGTAVEEGVIDVNPVQIKGAGRTKRVRRIEPASLEELATLSEHLDERYHAFVDVAAWCALRFGELTALRRQDVDLKAGVIRVRQAVTWVGGAPVVGTPKSAAGVRDVTIPPHLTDGLRHHLDTYAEPGRNGLVFPAVGGGYLNHGSFYKRWREAREAAGRPDLRLHDARHTGAVLAARAGATLKELMTRLGHSSPTTALLYQHAADDRAAELARKLSAMTGYTDDTEGEQ